MAALTVDDRGNGLFLMHRVELKELKLTFLRATMRLFLMHRVELKVFKEKAFETYSLPIRS